MDAYSQDLRDRVLRALERGDRPTAIANRFEVSRVWVYQVRNRLMQTGQRSSLPIGGHRQSRLAGMEPTLRAWLKETGDLTLAECSGSAPSTAVLTARHKRLVPVMRSITAPAGSMGGLPWRTSAKTFDPYLPGPRGHRLGSASTGALPAPVPPMRCRKTARLDLQTFSASLPPGEENRGSHCGH